MHATDGAAVRDCCGGCAGMSEAGVTDASRSTFGWFFGMSRGT